MSTTLAQSHTGGRIVLARPDIRQIVQTNSAFCRMLGCDSDEFFERSIVDVTHVDDRDPLQDAVRGSSAPDHGVEIRYLTRSRAVAWERVRLTRLGAGEDQPGFLLILAEDTTRSAAPI